MPAASTSSSRSDWMRIAASGLLGGLVINAVEWLVHRVWLDAEWTQAFAALGKRPMGWNTFVMANFLVGIVAVWTYDWLGRIYGRGVRTAIRSAVAIWIVFWVIPILGMQPMSLFPNSLLAWVIGIGIVDGLLGVLPAIWIYERLT